METRKTLFDPEIVKNPWKKEADRSAGRLKAHNPQYTQMMLQQWGRGLPKWWKCLEQDGLGETGRVILGVQWGPFITAHLPSCCPSPSQMCSKDEHLCFQVAGTLDFKRQGGALGSNDTLEGWWYLVTGLIVHCSAHRQRPLTSLTSKSK